MSETVVVVDPGSIGQAVARRVSAEKHVLLADLVQQNAEDAAVVLGNAGFDASTTVVDVSSRESMRELVGTATELGEISGMIQALGRGRKCDRVERCGTSGYTRRSWSLGRCPNWIWFSMSEDSPLSSRRP
jgi:NAD(P)-dependent dehydrogenase (short-subunit alcohol dehydrogenase family)